MLRETAFRRCPVGPTTLLSCRISLSSAHEVYSRTVGHAGHTANTSNSLKHAPRLQGHGCRAIAGARSQSPAPFASGSARQKLSCAPSKAAPTSTARHTLANRLQTDYSDVLGALHLPQAPTALQSLQRCTQSVALASHLPRPSSIATAQDLQMLAGKQAASKVSPRVLSVISAITLSGAVAGQQIVSSSATSKSDERQQPSSHRRQSGTPGKHPVLQSTSPPPSVSVPIVPQSDFPARNHGDHHLTLCAPSPGGEGPPRQPEKKQKKKDPAVLRVSKADATELASALDRLQAELPEIFSDSRHFSIYSEDVVLENQMYPFNYRTQGFSLYRTQASMIQAKWRLLCRDLEFHLLSSQKRPDESCVVVRWKIVGCPRWLPGKMTSPERMRYLDGLSTFEVNGLGQVHRHKVTKVRRDGEVQFMRTLPAMGIVALGLAGLKKELCDNFCRVFRR
ncbi:uncharacterized protein LOC135830589 [Sycon ciliatum]|uniref:uncharacterized protein LOC135830589 n=1 Tax=Sycon ciliatum TaxID=27933 RepID=UPI0031F6D79E